MSTGRPQSKADLVEYIKAKLGHPYYNVEISSEQFDFIVADALNFMKDYLPDFTHMGIVMLNTIQGQSEYQLDPDVFAVTECLDRSIYEQFFLRFPTADRSPEEVSFIMSISSQSRGAAMSDMSIAMQNLSAFKEMFLPKTMWRFNFNNNRLYFMSTPNTNTNAGLQNQYALLCEKTVDVDGTGTGNIYSNFFLLNYVVAIAKIQLGNNLMKYNVSNLPGGLTLNGDRYITEGREEKDKIEAEVKEKCYATTPGALGVFWG